MAHRACEGGHIEALGEKSAVYIRESAEVLVEVALALVFRLVEGCEERNARARDR